MPGSGYVARFQDVYYYSKDKNMENETMPVGGDAVEGILHLDAGGGSAHLDLVGVAGVPG